MDHNGIPFRTVRGIKQILKEQLNTGVGDSRRAKLNEVTEAEEAGTEEA